MPDTKKPQHVPHGQPHDGAIRVSHRASRSILRAIRFGDLMEIVRSNQPLSGVNDPAHHRLCRNALMPAVPAHRHAGHADFPPELRAGYPTRTQVFTKRHTAVVTKVAPRRQASVTTMAAQSQVPGRLPCNMPNRLKILRDERNLTQEQVAEKIKTTKQQYGRLENSKRRLAEHWIRPLAEAFGVHPGELWEEMPASPLTFREANLLEVFRKLDEPRQDAVVQTIDALTQSQAPQLKSGTDG